MIYFRSPHCGSRTGVFQGARSRCNDLNVSSITKLQIKGRDKIDNPIIENYSMPS